MRTITQIIEQCGGPEVIEKAAGTKVAKSGARQGKQVPKLSHWAIRKWPTSGIPEWHWPLLRTLLADLSVVELHAANEAARASEAA